MTPTQQGIVEQLERHGWTLAVAESLSGGLLTDAFAKAGDASKVPAGTVWIGTAVDGTVAAQLFEFTGDPLQVVDATCDAAMTILLAALRG